MPAPRHKPFFQHDVYRNTPEYQRAQDAMVYAAHFHHTICYGDTVRWVGGTMPQTWPQMPSHIGQLCGEISEDHLRAGRPMLSAVVVRKETGIPGPGFFDLAEYYDRIRPGETAATFWKREIEAVYHAWQQRPRRGR